MNVENLINSNPTEPLHSEEYTQKKEEHLKNILQFETSLNTSIQIATIMDVLQTKLGVTEEDLKSAQLKVMTSDEYSGLVRQLRQLKLDFKELN